MRLSSRCGCPGTQVRPIKSGGAQILEVQRQMVGTIISKDSQPENQPIHPGRQLPLYPHLSTLAQQVPEWHTVQRA